MTYYVVMTDDGPVLDTEIEEHEEIMFSGSDEVTATEFCRVAQANWAQEPRINEDDEFDICDQADTDRSNEIYSDLKWKREL